MRISDWSSDVCSSDLCGVGQRSVDLDAFLEHVRKNQQVEQCGHDWRGDGLQTDLPEAHQFFVKQSREAGSQCGAFAQDGADHRMASITLSSCMMRTKADRKSTRLNSSH